VDDQHTLYNIYHAYAGQRMDRNDGNNGGSWETDMSADMKLADRIMDSNLGA
jgi:hypothetical protein